MAKKIGVLFAWIAWMSSLPTFGNLPADSIAAANNTVTEDSLLRSEYDIPTVTLEDIEANDEAVSDQGISPVLNAGRDPFYSAATFSFSISRFRIRGYDNDYFETYMNGIPTEYIDNGFSAFNLWAGLNDVIRNRENVLGLRPATFAFGSIGGVYAIDSRASKQRKQLSVTLGTSNRTYDMRGGLTWGSGISKKGWSFAVSAFGRWAKSGYIKGTSMRSISYFASIEKLMKNHSLSLTAFGAPTVQGRSNPAIQELYDITGNNYYNPNWGYQNGEVRNSRVERRHQPMFILNHEWKIKNNANLTTAVGYTFGERALSNLFRWDANDPRPDYYKKLPSYDLYNGDTIQYLLGLAQLTSNPDLLQVQWDELYAANQSDGVSTVEDVDGIPGNSVTGKRAHYIVGEEVQSHQRVNFNSVYNHAFQKGIDLSAGVMYQYQNTRNFRRVKDLLGADFYLDVDDFVEDTAINNTTAAYPNIDQPNHVVYVGDKFGYDYNAVVSRTSAWGQINHRLDHIDYFVSAELSYTSQYRKGNFRSGLAPDNSAGESAKFSYFNYAIKGGLTYKINGKNYLYASGMYMTRAPYWDNVFISPRNTNNAFDPGSERIGSAEIGYKLNSSNIKLYVGGYYTDFNNGSNTFFFFDDNINSFGNYTVTDINKVHFGGELAVEAKVYKGLSATFVAAVGKYYFSSRQTGRTTIDVDPTFLDTETIYSKNFYVANTPQQAYTFGLYYRSKKFWYLSANVNFFDRMYTEMAPNHRTIRATDGVEYGSDLWNSIVDQQRVNQKGQWTLDLSGGYSWRLKSTFKGMDNGNMYLVLNAGITNLTNNRKFIASSREQLRYDYDQFDPGKFPPRYSYAFGINFYTNLTFRF